MKNNPSRSDYESKQRRDFSDHRHRVFVIDGSPEEAAMKKATYADDRDALGNRGRAVKEHRLRPTAPTRTADQSCVMGDDANDAVGREDERYYQADNPFIANAGRWDSVPHRLSIRGKKRKIHCVRMYISYGAMHGEKAIHFIRALCGEPAIAGE